MRISLFSFLLLFLTYYAAYNQNPNPNPDLDAFIMDEMVAERLPGLSTVMVKDGEIVWVESYGMANFETNTLVEDSTIFLLASVSKLFTGTAAMQMVEEGWLNLDAPVNDYLPFTIDHPNSAIPITARMLMTHTSGIRDNFSVMENYYSWGDPTISLEEVIERYLTTSGIDYDPNSNFFSAAPGTDFRYSNIGIALLGYLVEVVSEDAFSQVCIESVFDPICMDDTRWFLNELDSTQMARPYTTQSGAYLGIPHYGFADYPNGLLRSSVQDLARFMLTYLEGGALNGTQILETNTIATMWSNQIPGILEGQGLVWYQEEIFLNGGGTEWLWGHNGGESGASTDLYIDQENNLGIAVLANGEGTNLFIVDQLYNYGLTLQATGSGISDCSSPSSLIEKPVNNKESRIWPNPSLDGWVQIWWPEEGQYQLRIFDVQGRLVEEQHLSGTSGTFYLPSLGGYLVQTINQEGQMDQKWIIRK